MLISPITREILKGSLKIIKTDKEVLLISIIPAVISSFLSIGFIIFLISVFDAKKENIGIILFLIVLFLVLIIVIVSLSRVVLIYSVWMLLNNKKISLRESFLISKKRFLEIIKWTIVDMLFRIGVVNLNRKELSNVTSLLALLSTNTWKVLTIFILPSIVIENLTTKEAIKKSYQMLTKTWRTAGVLDFSLDLIFLIMGIIGVFLIPILLLIFGSFAYDFIANYGEILLIVMHVMFMIILFIIGIFIVTLREIFVVVLYNYAVFNKIPILFFSEASIKKAFK